MYQKKKQVFVVDFDNTILPFGDETFKLGFQELLGDKYCKELYQLYDGKKSFTDKFIDKYKYDIDKSEIKILWNNFTKSKLFRAFEKLESLGKLKFDEIYEQIKKIPEGENALSYYIESIIFPLIDLANVCVYKLKPCKEFVELATQVELLGGILVINTAKPQSMIENELSLFASSGNYVIFNKLIQNKLIFGTTLEHCKFNNNRIEFIINELIQNKLVGLSENNVQNVAITIIGDGGTDIKNFEDYIKENPRQPATFLLVDKSQQEVVNDVCKDISIYNSWQEKYKKDCSRLTDICGLMETNESSSTESLENNDAIMLAGIHKYFGGSPAEMFHLAKKYLSI